VSRSALPRIALLALIWGSAFLWIKLANRGFSPVEITFARLTLGAVVLFAIVRIRREAIPRSRLLWAHIAVAALFANAVPAGLEILESLPPTAVVTGSLLEVAGRGRARMKEARQVTRGGAGGRPAGPHVGLRRSGLP